MLRGPRDARAGWSSPTVALIVVMLLLTFGPAVAQAPSTEEDGRVRGYVPPPTDLKLVGDHWTPYDPPMIPEGVEVHVVQKGDTLWDLAAAAYSDPYLWPVIWDANRYVTYSHWIYPGDPLEIPPQPAVVGEEGVVVPEEPAEPAPAPPAPREPPPAPKPAPEPPKPAGPVLIPVLDAGEQTCSIELVEYFDPTPLWIAGSEEPDKSLLGEGDIIYLSAGSDMGIEAGAEYVVVRSGGSVRAPGNTRNAAVELLHRFARARVITVQGTSATAELVDSCKAVSVGDYLVPFRPTPVPMVERRSLAELAEAGPGRLNGMVVVTREEGINLAGEGDLIAIDLGTRAGLTAGDRVLIWRPGTPGTPRRVLAHGVITIANAGGSTVKLLESRSEVLVGDRVQVM